MPYPVRIHVFSPELALENWAFTVPVDQNAIFEDLQHHFYSRFHRLSAPDELRLSFRVLPSPMHIVPYSTTKKRLDDSIWEDVVLDELIANSLDPQPVNQHVSLTSIVESEPEASGGIYIPVKSLCKSSSMLQPPSHSASFYALFPRQIAHGNYGSAPGGWDSIPFSPLKPSFECVSRGEYMLTYRYIVQQAVPVASLGLSSTQFGDRSSKGPAPVEPFSESLDYFNTIFGSNNPTLGRAFVCFAVIIWLPNLTPTGALSSKPANNEWPKIKGVAITGQPGIGKHIFNPFLLLGHLLYLHQTRRCASETPSSPILTVDELCIARPFIYDLQADSESDLRAFHSTWDPSIRDASMFAHSLEGLEMREEETKFKINRDI
ncbi:hypothetical protein OF83DRAFT_1174117 [Amylostereum chailletii]|nr:hypothetical protein OF83DRAFT_1174117 [Amylostereum chailletii]